LSRSEVIHNTPLLLMLLIGFGGQFAMMLFQSTWSLYAGDVLFQNMSAADVTLRAGLLFAVHGVGQLLTQLLLIEPLAVRFGEHRLVILGAILRALSLWSLVLLPFPLSVATIGMLGFAVGSGTMMPPLQSLVTTSVREEVSGAVLGIYQSAVSLGIISGAVLSGFLFEHSPFLPYAVAGVIFMLTVMPASLLSRMGLRAAAIA
ncbi:MAG: MFS transporter, partial [Anaerolineae bacterium]|nr:MFS transporter [Anaerolineae bacterium]